MQKKIAIVFNRMIVGGAETALINLINAIDRKSYHITLFTYDRNCAYLDELPPDVELRFTKAGPSDISLSHLLKQLRLGDFLRSLYCRILMRLSTDSYKRFEYNIRCLPRFSEYFDCAISYKLNYEDTATTLWRVRASKKCVVAHSDVGLPQDQPSCYIKNAINKFHRVFCVSDKLSQSVCAIVPQKAHKIQTLHNIVPIHEIIKKANEPIAETLQPVAIVTVGRLSPEKGQDIIPEAVHLLLNRGYNVHWYLVGDGPLREAIQQRIHEYHVEARVVLLGTKSNPYPYMKNCDIYVQTSHSEGWCLTTQEAKILCKPIITTPLPVMQEQFISGENGLIADTATPESLANSIITLLDHPELQEKFRKNLQSCTFDNSTELQILYDFMDS